jgi:hypothetical protein
LIPRADALTVNCSPSLSATTPTTVLAKRKPLGRGLRGEVSRRQKSGSR